VTASYELQSTQETTVDRTATDAVSVDVPVAPEQCMQIWIQVSPRLSVWVDPSVHRPAPAHSSACSWAAQV
jgi:hypothetical protein